MSPNTEAFKDCVIHIGPLSTGIYISAFSALLSITNHVLSFLASKICCCLSFAIVSSENCACFLHFLKYCFNGIWEGVDINPFSQYLSNSLYARSIIDLGDTIVIEKHKNKEYFSESEHSRYPGKKINTDIS